jgi:hypothetical protein
MKKNKFTRDVPLPSSDGLFPNIKGRSLKDATATPTSTIKNFAKISNDGDDIVYKDRKVPTDRTGRAIGDFPLNGYDYEVSPSGQTFGRSRYKDDLKAVSAAGAKNKKEQRRQQIYKKVDAKMAADKKK